MENTSLETFANVVVGSCIAQWNEPHGDTPIPCGVSVAGIGKTSVVMQSAEALSEIVEKPVNTIVLRLADKDYSDLAGWSVPSDDKTQMVEIPPAWLAEVRSRPDENFIVFYDELAQARVPNLNACAQTINERTIGSHSIPDNLAFVAATNPQSSKAGTNVIPSHLKDRLSFIYISANARQAVDYGLKNGWHPFTVAYLEARPDNVSKFDKDADSCASPRSWGKISTIEHNRKHLSEQAYTALVMGTVGDGIGADYLAFVRLAEKFPSLDSVIASPSTAEVPAEIDVKYAVCAGLSARTDKNNVGAILEYLERLGNPELTAMAVRNALKRDYTLKSNRDIKAWASTEGADLLR